MARPFGTKKYQPDELWDLFQGYKQFCEDNPETQEISHPKFGTQIIRHKRPYLESDWIIYADMGWDTWINYKKAEGSYKDYYEVSTRILNEISGQKVRGATVGAYNANIVSRIEGLKDRADVTSNDIKIDFSS